MFVIWVSITVNSELIVEKPDSILDPKVCKAANMDSKMAGGEGAKLKT